PFPTRRSSDLQERRDEKEDCHHRRGAAGSRGRKRSRLPCSSHLFSLLGSRLAFPETPRGRRRAPRLGAGRACVIPETARGGAEFPYRAEPSGSAVAVAIAVLVLVEADEPAVVGINPPLQIGHADLHGAGAVVV